jgi:ssRNA-specific RNase YbeY (16S rRNA maturation enzyme)
VLLVCDRDIAQAHARCFGEAHPTDVITQAYRPIPPERSGRAEILINLDRARRPPRGGSPDHELALYLAHGFDHLGGGRDGTATARARMLRRERRWLAAARQEGVRLEFGLDEAPS